jgi:hypothetical protein
MADDSRREAEEAPEFEDVFPDLEVAEELLKALAREDYEAVEEIRDQPGVDWWNVAWTLALLLRGFRRGEPASLELVESMMGRAAESGRESEPR